jgi:hypothetical protein
MSDSPNDWWEDDEPDSAGNLKQYYRPPWYLGQFANYRYQPKRYRQKKYPPLDCKWCMAKPRMKGTGWCSDCRDKKWKELGWIK